MKKKIDLTKGSITFRLLLVAIPTLLSSLVQMAYNLTDMFWVGKVHTMGLDETEAIAAVGTAGYLPWFAFGLILLAKIGTSVSVSQAAGKDDMELVERYGNNGLLYMLVLALFYMAIGFFGADLYVSIFKLDNANIIAYATDYLRIVTMFGFALFSVNLFNGIYEGLGKTFTSFKITASGLVLNIVLDPFFILEKVNVFGFTFDGLGYGVKGAAIATVIAQSFVLLIYLLIYSSRFRPFRIRLIKNFDRFTMKKIIKIGLPVGLQNMAFTIISVVVGVMIAKYGKEVIATQRLGSQIEALAWMVASGFQVALAAFVGQNFGAEQPFRIRRGYFTALRLLIPYGIIINLVLFFFARDLFAIFITDPETLDIGEKYLRILSVSQVFMIVELGTAGAFNGLGKTMIPSSVGFVGNLLRIPFGFLAGYYFGFIGIWWVISISSVLKGTVLTIWFLIDLKKVKDEHVMLVENV
ncbi:MAG: MATE family efflux transporter [Candidatus Izemoplasmataceae bacterium]